MSESGIDDRGFALEQTDRAADAHGRHGRRDLHAVATVGDLSRDEGKGALDEGEQRVVRGAGDIVGIVVERHTRAGNDIKRRAVREGDAAGRIGGGFDDVAFVDRVADMKR